MRIKKLSFTKAQLQAIPEYDRRRLVELMMLQDELSTLSIAVTLSKPTRIGASNDTDAVQWGQMWFYVRLLAGKLHEARLWLDQVAFNNPNSMVIQRALPPESKRALDSLKVTFGKHRKVFADLRNQTAFHFDSTEVLEAYNALPVDTVFTAWATPHFGTSRNDVADTVYRQMAISIMGRPDGLEAAVELAKLVTDTALDFGVFVAHWLSALVKSHIPLDDGETAEVEDVHVEYLPALFDLEAWTKRNIDLVGGAL